MTLRPLTKCQSPTGDGSSGSASPPATDSVLNETRSVTSIPHAAPVQEPSWDLLVSAFRTIPEKPSLRETPWDLIMSDVHARAFEDARQIAAAYRPQCSVPPPPPGRPNRLSYQKVWLCPTGHKAHIQLDCVQSCRPYSIMVMAGSFNALNWCQRCASQSIRDAFAKQIIGCDGAVNRHDENPWGELD